MTSLHRARSKILAAFVLGSVPIILPFLLRDYRVFELDLVLVGAIAVLGLNILVGYTGQISLGHSAFLAIGAYVTALLMNRAGWAYWAAVPAGGAACFGAGVAMGFPALRLRGHYLALATYALALSVPPLLKSRYLEGLTGGAQGMALPRPAPPQALQAWCSLLSADRWLYFFTLAVAASLFWLARNHLHGRTGRALIAIRDQPLAASVTGIDLARYKALAFGVSAAYAGIAGGLGALAVAFVSPDSFTVAVSIDLLVGVVIGGLASVPGALFGAAFIQFVPSVTDRLSPSLPWALYGMLLIGCMHLLPGGFMGMLRNILGRLQPHIASYRYGRHLPLD
jgi:branched-chain amino acid transport system permease protein